MDVGLLKQQHQCQKCGGAMKLKKRIIPKIGGPGSVVEIDETKVTKRKANTGRVSESHKDWLVGGICRQTGEVFLERTPVRSGPVLMAIAMRHVEPGTLIITDCWRGYNGLRDSPFRHATVNHRCSINTQRVENRNLIIEDQAYKGRGRNLIIEDQAYKGRGVV
uniref:ISXO2-like transposase domain-containing protein n=1 Tax=Anopheles atroparvus TaxID=41427 RepID=A0A182IV94_ANOAO